jgi:hypothetical protein
VTVLKHRKTQEETDGKEKNINYSYIIFDKKLLLFFFKTPGEISWHPSTGAIAQLMTLFWFEVCSQVVTCKLHVQLEFSLNSWVIS